MKTALTDAQVAALAEGAPIQAETQAVVPTAPEAETAPEATTQEAPAAEAAAPVVAEGTVIGLLKSQLAEAQAQVVDLTVQLKSAQTSVTASQAAASSFRAVAQASVDRMKVALGMPSGVAAASDEALMAEHATLRSTFEAKFKSGGVAAVSTEAASKEGAGSQPDSARLARIQATRLI